MKFSSILILLHLAISPLLLAHDIQVRGQHKFIIGPQGIVVDGSVSGPHGRINERTVTISPSGNKVMFYAFDEEKQAKVILALLLENKNEIKTITNPRVKDPENVIMNRPGVRLHKSGRWVYAVIGLYQVFENGPPIFNPEETEVSFPVRKAGKDIESGKDIVVTLKQITTPVVSHKVEEGSQKMSRIDKEEWEKSFEIRESSGFDGIGGIKYSPDGRLAIQAKRGELWFIVIGDQEHGPYQNLKELYFNADGSRFGFGGQKDDSWLVVENGVEGSTGYDDLGRTFFYGPKGKRLAYAVKVAERWKYLIDGKAEEDYETVYSLVFSTDGSRYAYWAGQGQKKFLIVDGERQSQEFENPGWNPVFSPDSVHIGVVAANNDTWDVIVDGKKVSTVQGNVFRTPIFTPDGAHLLYGVCQKFPNPKKRKKYINKCYLYANEHLCFEVTPTETWGLGGLFDQIKGFKAEASERALLYSLPPAGIALMLVEEDDRIFNYYAKTGKELPEGYYHSAAVLLADKEVSLIAHKHRINYHRPERSTDKGAHLRWANPIQETEFTLLFPHWIPQSEASREREVKQRLDKGHIYLLRQVKGKRSEFYIQDLTALLDSFTKSSN